MSQELFRQEVFAGKRNTGLGSISLAQPVRLWVFTAVAATVALVILLFLIFGTYTRRSRVEGQLVPVQGMAAVLMPETGVIARVEVSEGMRVVAGQRLAVVIVPRATVADGNTAAAFGAQLKRRGEGVVAKRTARRQQLDAQETGLEAQLLASREELVQIEAETSTKREQLRLANETLERLQKLRDANFVSELQLKQQQSAALERMSEIQSLQRQIASTNRLISQLEQSARELHGQRLENEAEYQRDMVLLEQEQVETAARGELAIIAPVDGVVATQMFKSGQTAQAGQIIMSVLPGAGLLEAELLIPSRAIGFIEPGDIVLLRYEAYPYQKFGHYKGRVVRISQDTVGATSMENTGTKSEAKYRVSVALDQQAIMALGRIEPLRPGMALDADVLGEKRTLIEWILEPLYSIKGDALGG